MRNQKGKIICVIMATAMVAMGVAGCGSTTESSSGDATATKQTEETTTEETVTLENTFSYTDSTDTELKSTTIMGSISSIDDNALTLAIANMGGTAPTDGAAPTDGTTPPDGTSQPDGTAPADGTTPPDGTSQPDGTAPSDGTAPENGTQQNMTTSTGVLTIQDETVVSGIALADVAEGNMVSITFDENGTITAIAISEAPTTQNSGN